jgi:hypothetical protein
LPISKPIVPWIDDVTATWAEHEEVPLGIDFALEFGLPFEGWLQSGQPHQVAHVCPWVEARRQAEETRAMSSVFLGGDRLSTPSRSNN